MPLSTQHSTTFLQRRILQLVLKHILWRTWRTITCDSVDVGWSLRSKDTHTRLLNATSYGVLKPLASPTYKQRWKISNSTEVLKLIPQWSWTNLSAEATWRRSRPSINEWLKAHYPLALARNQLRVLEEFMLKNATTSWRTKVAEHYLCKECICAHEESSHMKNVAINVEDSSGWRLRSGSVEYLLFASLSHRKNRTIKGG